MNKDDINVVKTFEEQLRDEEEYERRKKLDEEYNEAKQSATFNVFNAVIRVIAAVSSASFCGYFLWQNNKVLLLIVVILVVASIIFGVLAKRNFRKGNRKKFETFNRLSGATGVASSLFELADMNGSKSKGALSKVDSVTNALSNAKMTVAEVQFRGGTYVDVKYDSIRKRAIGTGVYIYRNQQLDSIHNMIKKVDDCRKENKMSKGDKVKLSVLIMYVKDVMAKDYGVIDDLFYASLGSLFYFLKPLSELPNDLPLVGFRDNMFVPYCVYAGFDKKLDEYKKWKIATTKSNMINTALDNVDLIWDTLCDAEISVARTVDSLIEKSISYVDENREVGKEVIDAVVVLSKLTQDWFNGNYDNVDKRTISGIINTLSYVVLEDDYMPDNLSALGYVDDFVVVKCCMLKCDDFIRDYKVWEKLTELQKENDPLVEYLNTVVGQDEKLREIEVRRLAKLCRVESIEGLENRARQTVKDLQI